MRLRKELNILKDKRKRQVITLAGREMNKLLNSSSSYNFQKNKTKRKNQHFVN